MSSPTSPPSAVPSVSSVPSPSAAPSVSLPSLGFYERLARGGRAPRTYRGKLFLVAFVGTHVPLLTLLFCFLASQSRSSAVSGAAVLIALAATLAATGATLWAVGRLLAPVEAAQKSLSAYLSHGTLPTLPTGFEDEAGRLMADTQRTVARIDDLIRYLTSHDGLTLLPNRERFEAMVDDAMATAGDDAGIAVFVLDIKGFHGVNDVLGQAAGDDILGRVAGRLQAALGDADGGALARFGGDEFAILRRGASDPAAAERFTRTLLDAVHARPYLINGLPLTLALRAGIALPGQRAEATSLVRDAEAALYEAKRRDADVLFFSDEIDRRLHDRARLEADLRAAVARGDLALFFQPQVDAAAAGRVTGVEALLRWQRKGGDGDAVFVPPGEFLPLAEESDLIFVIGEWTLWEACRQGRRWQEAGLPPVRVAVNLSARQFALPDLPTTVARALAETGLDPSLLELEITESAAMGDAERTVAVLEQLRAMGVGLALDDFGTGYSSLAYLQRFPIDTVKLDRRFVSDICSNPDDAAIADAVIALAHSLRLRAVAEGVETTDQRDRLREAGCDSLQGYLYSRPVPADEIARLIGGASPPPPPVVGPVGEVVWSKGKPDPAAPVAPAL